MISASSLSHVCIASWPPSIFPKYCLKGSSSTKGIPTILHICPLAFLKENIPGKDGGREDIPYLGLFRVLLNLKEQAFIFLRLPFFHLLLLEALPPVFDIPGQIQIYLKFLYATEPIYARKSYRITFME